MKIGKFVVTGLLICGTILGLTFKPSTCEPVWAMSTSTCEPVLTMDITNEEISDPYTCEPIIVT